MAPSLVFFLLVYAAIGTWLTTAVFGKRLMQLQFLQLQKEGDLRFDLVRARENSGAPRQHVLSCRLTPLQACLRGALLEGLLFELQVLHQPKRLGKSMQPLCILRAACLSNISVHPTSARVTHVHPFLHPFLDLSIPQFVGHICGSLNEPMFSMPGITLHAHCMPASMQSP